MSHHLRALVALLLGAMVAGAPARASDWGPPEIAGWPASTGEWPTNSLRWSPTTGLEREAPGEPAVLGLHRLLQTRLPRTPVLAVRPSAVPWLYRVEMQGGKLAYVEATGRYLVIGVILDLHTGQALDGVLDGVSSNTPPASE